MTNSIKILLIEDNPGDIRLIQEYLREVKIFQFDLVNVNTLNAAKEILNKEKFDIILLDLNLPDSNGLATFNCINKIIFEIPIIVITGIEDEEMGVTAVKEGAQDYLTKANINGSSLARAIIYAIERKEAEKNAKELAAIIESANEAIMGVTLDGLITNWNRAAEQKYGYTQAEIIDAPIDILFPPERKNELEQILALIKIGEKIKQHETLLQTKNKTRLDVSLTVSPIKITPDRTIGASIIAHDISQTKRHEQQLAVQYRVALALSEAANLNEAAQSILKTICEIFGWQVGEIWAVDRDINALRLISSWYANENYHALEKISHDITYKIGEGLPGHIWQINKPYLVTDLNEGSLLKRKHFFLKKKLRSCFGFPIFFHNEVMGTVLFFNENMRPSTIDFITLFSTIGNQIGTFIKRKRAERDLLYLAQHDLITGLANRVTLENNLNAAIASAKIDGKLIAVLYLDLDNFKKINDSMGHAKGDLLLQEVGARISKSVRRDDTVARFGGDEFIVLLSKISGTKDIAHIAQKLLETIALPIHINSSELYISASIGISIYPDNGHNVQTLLKNADMAMYYAKVQGRHNYQFCVPSMAMQSQHKLTLEGQLHDALKHHELILYYQPQVDIKTNKIVGLEALVRWDRQGERITAPDQFIPLAEEVNLINPIGKRVLQTACLQAKQWQEQKLPPITLAVNISILQFNPKLLTLLRDILDRTGLAAKYLELELTESTLMNLSEKNVSLIHSIKDLGIKLAIDDFGTGYSSFSYLKNFRTDVIKIDQSFIFGLPDDAKSKAIVSAIIAMAHSLEIKVIAEGVENLAQLALLKEMGCDEYQGFLFSKPLPAKDIYKLLVNKNKPS